MTFDSQLSLVSSQEIQDHFARDYPVKLCPAVWNLRSEMIAMQEYLHRHPELSNKEFKTSKFIANYLRKLNESQTVNLEIQTNVANNTGVIATLTGSKPGPCILLRADMDALPLNEANDLAYKSTIADVMHACGHDYHVTILLMTARIFCVQSRQQQMRGSVKFLFQPAEEVGLGARDMLADTTANLVANVDQVYGLHVSSNRVIGNIDLNNGALMSGASHIVINMVGEGGHGAYPHQTTDVVVAGSALIQQIQTIVSRNIDPLEMGIITVGACHCGTKGNVICDRLEMKGTIRWFKSHIEQVLKTRLLTVCESIRTMFRLKSVVVDFGEYSYPSVINSQLGFDTVCNAAVQFVGEQGLNRTSKPSCASEDFSEFLIAKPGAFFFVGGGIEELNPDSGKYEMMKLYPHHSPIFVLDQRCLLIGCQAMTQIVIDLLFNNSNGNGNGNNNAAMVSKL